MNSKQIWAGILVVAGILVLARALACENPDQHYCCSDTGGCAWREAACNENDPCAGVPRMDPALQNGNVNIYDMPLAYYPAKGPAFQLRTAYSSARDDARQQSHTGGLGYRWEHEYEMCIRRLGTSPKWRWERLGGQNIDYLVTNGVWQEQRSMGNNGKYALFFVGSNVVARRITWATMANKLRRPSCSRGSCGGNPWGNRDFGEFLPPYESWSPNEGYVFEPMPSKATNQVMYRLKTIVAADGGKMELEYGVTNLPIFGPVTVKINSRNIITNVPNNISQAANIDLKSGSTNSPSVKPKIGIKGYRSVSVLRDIRTADGKNVRFQYDKSLTLVTNVCLPDGRHAAFEYSRDGRNMLAAMTDMAGLRFGFTYETNGLMTGFIKPNQQITRIFHQRTPDGLLMTSIQHPEGNGKFVYDDEQTTLEGPTGQGVLVRKIKSGRFSFGAGIVKKVDGDGLTTEYTRYDGTNIAAVGQNSSKKLPNGTRVEIDYDAMGRLAGERHYDATNRLYLIKRIERELFKDTLHTKILRTVEESADGRLLSEKIEEYVRDDRNTANMQDDLFNLAAIKTRIDSERMAEQRFDYNRDGHLSAIRERTGMSDDAFITTKIYKYDENGRVVCVQDALSNSVASIYDESGRVISIVRTAGGNSTATSYEYDNLDRVVKKIDPDKTMELWVYAACGCGIESHTDRAGDTTLYQYDRNGRKVEELIVSKKGTKQDRKIFHYDRQDRQIAVEDALSNCFQTVYTPGGLVMTTMDPLGRITSNQYDRAGNLMKTVRPDGLVQEIRYNLRGERIATLTSPSDGGEPVETRTLYDELGRKTAETDALGNTTRHEYGLDGRIVKTISPDGAVIENKYDWCGNQTAVVGPYYPTASEPGPVVSISYDSANRRTHSVDAMGRDTYWEYSPLFPKKVLVIRNARGVAIQSNEYDSIVGEMTATVERGVRTKFERDVAGRVTATLFPDGSVERKTYDGALLVQSISRSGVTNANEYDAVGRLVAVRQAGTVRRIGYDAAGNRIYSTDELGQTTSNCFNSANMLIATVRPDGSVAVNDYDGMGRQVAKTGAGQLPVAQVYDAVGRLNLLKDGNDNPTRFYYDAVGRLVKKTYADGKFHAYRYDATGRLCSRVDPNGYETRYTYDLAGQLFSTSYAHDGNVLYAYDLLGRMTQRTDKAGIWSWTYDGDSRRVLSESLLPADGSDRQNVAYTYDPVTRERLTLMVNGRSNAVYQYAAGRLQAVVAGEVEFRYGYKADSDMVREVARYRRGQIQPELRAEYTYDIAKRLKSLRYLDAASQESGSTVYDLNILGQRVVKTDERGCAIRYIYDPFDQLVKAEKLGNCPEPEPELYRYLYEYDMAGNRLTAESAKLRKVATYNRLNQLLNLRASGAISVAGNVEDASENLEVMVAGQKSKVFGVSNFIGAANVLDGLTGVAVQATSSGQTALRSVPVRSDLTENRFEYNANGNLLNDGVRKYVWDDENRLLCVEPLSPVKGDKKVVNIYDAQWRRSVKMVYVWNDCWQLEAAHRFIYDGWNLIYESIKKPAGVIEISYVWGLDLADQRNGRLASAAGGIGGLLVTIRSDASGTTDAFPLADGNGNILAYVKGSNEIIARREYSPFGEMVSCSGAMQQSFAIWSSSKYIDAEMDLVYYGYRYYIPLIGRFLSRDPVNDVAFLFNYKTKQRYMTTVRSDIISSLYNELYRTEQQYQYRYLNNNDVKFYDPHGLSCGHPPSAEQCVCSAGSNVGTKQNTSVSPEEADGCSVPDWVLDFIPIDKDNPSGDCPFIDCCNNHDCQYQICNYGRHNADDTLYYCMLAKCDLCGGTDLQITACKAWAVTYYIAVYLAGGSIYDSSQTDMCQTCCCS